MEGVSNYNSPAWPTVRWVVGEIKIYLLAMLVCGGGFLLTVSLAYSVGWAIFAVGLAMEALAMLALTLATRNPAPLGSTYYLLRLYPNPRTNTVSVLPVHPHRDDANGADEIPEELQKLLDSATRIAAENEALKSDIAQLRQRALRQRP